MNKYAKILDIEIYVPENEINNDILSDEFDISSEYIYKITGINKRYTSNTDEISSDLAVKAAEKMLQKKPHLRSEIDFILFCSQTFDYSSPSSACLIQDKLKLRKNIGAIDIGLGCSGFTYTLSLAKALIENGQVKNVLILTSETLTKYLAPDDKSTRLLFGDGASATLMGICEKEHIEKFVFGTDGSLSDIMHLKSGGFRHRNPTNNAYISEQKEIKYFKMDGAKVFEFSLREVPKLIKDILEINHVSPDFNELNWVILHQASKVVLDVLQKKLKIPTEKYLISLDKYGNTVSSTIPITLKFFLENSTIKKGDRILIAGFGVGLSWCGTVITI